MKILANAFLLAALALPGIEARKLGKSSKQPKSGQLGQTKSSKGCGTDICTCTDKEYIVSTSFASFPLHLVMAQELGCQLATIGSEAERQQIYSALQDDGPPPQAGAPGGNVYAWIGLLRPVACPENAPDSDCDLGDAREGWMWLDGCTEYTNDYWYGSQPNNKGQDGQYLGVMRYYTDTDDDGGIGDMNSDREYPAVYECCACGH